MFAERDDQDGRGVNLALHNQKKKKKKKKPKEKKNEKILTMIIQEKEMTPSLEGSRSNSSERHATVGKKRYFK